MHLGKGDLHTAIYVELAKDYICIILDMIYFVSNDTVLEDINVNKNSKGARMENQGTQQVIYKVSKVSSSIVKYYSHPLFR